MTIRDVCWQNPYVPAEGIRVPECIPLEQRLFLWKILHLFWKEAGWPARGPFRRTWWETEPLDQRLRATLGDLIPPDEYPRILSVGCAGREALMLAEKGYRPVGVDVNPADVLWTRQQGVEAFWMNMMDLQFPNEAFDAVCTSHAQEHGHAPWLQVLELWAILRPGGLALFVVPPYKEDDVGFNRPDGIHESHSACLSENQWAAIITRLGFEIVASRLCGDPQRSGHNAMLLQRQTVDDAFPNCRALLAERLAIGAHYRWPIWHDPRLQGVVVDDPAVAPPPIP